MRCSIRQDTVAADLEVAHEYYICGSCAGVAFYGIDYAIFAHLHDAEMVSRTIQVIAGSVEEDDVARVGLKISDGPLATVL